jgi:uncharacterized membrane protein
MKVWVIPAVYTAASIAVASVVPRLEHALVPGLAHGMSVASATAFLSATASGILAFTAIVFSIAFVMVQFNALAYSPRLVLWFAGRPELYHALGIFIATFTYAMATLLWTDRNGSGVVPYLSVMVVIALLCASMMIFALLVRSLTRLQITEVLSFVGDEGRKVVAAQEGFLPRQNARTHAEEARPRPASKRHVLYQGPPRSLCAIDYAVLVGLAELHGATLSVRVVVGDTVLDGVRLASLDAEAPALADDAVRRAFHLGNERTFEQDPKYPLRLLVDIAIKALSPAVNDPTTAVQAIDQIEDLVCRLARADLGSVWIADLAGVPRVFAPLPSWEDYLSLAFDEIRQFGASSVQVMRKLAAALHHVEDMCSDEAKRQVVEHYQKRLANAVRHSELLVGQDRSAALQADPQGLGFARDEEDYTRRG